MTNNKKSGNHSYAYHSKAWGAYYTNDNVRIIKTDELNKEKTLSLYLYGSLSRPQNPADYIRPIYTNRIEVQIDGQKYFDTIGSIIPYILAWKSSDISNFFQGKYDGKFSIYDMGIDNTVRLKLSEIDDNWAYGFEYVDFYRYPRWEDGTFIYNSAEFYLDENAEFVVTFDSDGNIVSRRIEKLKYYLGSNKEVHKNRDNYDYQTSGAFTSDMSRFLHGEYHDPFNIGRGFDIYFGNDPVWRKLLGKDGETWTEQHYRALKAQAEVWRGDLRSLFDLVGVRSTHVYWGTLGRKIATTLSGDDKPLKYQIGGIL